MSSVLKKADKLNLSLSLPSVRGSLFDPTKKYILFFTIVVQVVEKLVIKLSAPMISEAEVVQTTAILQFSTNFLRPHCGVMMFYSDIDLGHH